MSQDSLLPVRPVVWTAAARADLRDIAAYIGQDSPKNAAEMVERLIGAVQILGRFPMLYQASQRFTRVRNAREIPVPPYWIIYTVTDKTVIIVSILHGRQKFPRKG